MACRCPCRVVCAELIVVFLPWSQVNFHMCRFGSVYRRFLLPLSAYQFILLPMYPYVCVPVFLSIYLYLSVCLSVCLCQPVAAAWCHSSMSSLPVVVDLVCLTFLLVAWPCGCLVVCMQLCSAVLWCLSLMLISTCGVAAPSAVDGMSLSLPCCLRGA